MSAIIQPLSEVSHRAKNVLIQELGIIDAMRFLNQFQVGGGDYTLEREWLLTHDTTKNIVATIKMQRASKL